MKTFRSFTALAEDRGVIVRQVQVRDVPSRIRCLIITPTGQELPSRLVSAGEINSLRRANYTVVRQTTTPSRLPRVVK